MRWLGGGLLVLAMIGCWHGAPAEPAPADSGAGGAGAADVGGALPDAPPDMATVEPQDATDVHVADTGAAEAPPPPRPAGCDNPGALVAKTIFTEDFESYPVGAFENAAGSPWVRAAMGRNVEISTGAVSSGVHSLLIQSFFPKTETEYAPLAIDPLPPRISFTYTALLDGLIMYKDFVTVGLAIVRSKYDIVPVLALKMSMHELSLVASEDGGASQVLYEEIDYGDPPRANTVQVDVDLCTWTADVSVGVPTSPLAARAHVSLTPFASVSAIFVSGGVNESYLDAVSVRVQTP